MDVHLPGHRRHRGHPADHRARPDAPVVVLLSTYDEDQFDLDRLRRGGVHREGGVRPGPALSAPGTAPSTGATERRRRVGADRDRHLEHVVGQ